MSLSQTRTATEYAIIIEQQLDDFEPQELERTCHEAIAAYPEDLNILKLCADVCLDFGKVEEAETLLKKSISISPHDDHIKYFSLAQISSGLEAAKAYQSGIKILSETIKSIGGCSLPTPKEEMQRTLSNAHASLAELFMTDLCEEENAEELCEKNINSGIEVDPTNPEIYQTQARFKLVKEELEEAKKIITMSVNMWLPDYLKKLDTDDELECPLSYSARISAVLILLESALFKEAGDILDTLFNENTQDAYICYLMGWCYYLQNLKPKSKAYLTKTLQVHEMSPSSDLAMIDHTQSLLRSMEDIEEEASSSDEENFSDLDESDSEQSMDQD